MQCNVLVSPFFCEVPWCLLCLLCFQLLSSVWTFEYWYDLVCWGCGTPFMFCLYLLELEGWFDQQTEHYETLLGIIWGKIIHEILLHILCHYINVLFGSSVIAPIKSRMQEWRPTLVPKKLIFAVISIASSSVKFSMDKMTRMYTSLITTFISMCDLVDFTITSHV